MIRLLVLMMDCCTLPCAGLLFFYPVLKTITYCMNKSGDFYAHTPGIILA